MIRTFLLITTLLSFLTPIYKMAPKDEGDAKINELVVSPLKLDGNSYFIVDVSASKYAAVIIEIKISNEWVESQTIFTNAYKLSKRELIKYDNAYTSLNNEITFDVNIPLKKIKQSLTIVPDLTSSSYKAVDFNDEIISSSETKIYKNEKWISQKQRVSFDGFNDVYSPDYYHKFDPSELNILVNSSVRDCLQCESIVLSITNLNGYFGRFSNNKTVNFRLNLKDEGNGVFSLYFAQDLYVHPRTLEMSPTKGDDFIKTKNLFFPRNQMREQEDYKIGIQFEGFGNDSITFAYVFSCKALLNTMGDCYNSEYCIIDK